MSSVLAIISKSVFEKEHGKKVGLGEVLPITTYHSKHKGLQPLAEGGDLILVTVRPNDVLWRVGILRAPRFSGAAWTAEPNPSPVVDISDLVPELRFTSGKGIAAAPGKLGMSLQTPRALTDADVALLEADSPRAPSQRVSSPEAEKVSPEAPPEKAAEALEEELDPSGDPIPRLGAASVPSEPVAEVVFPTLGGMGLDRRPGRTLVAQPPRALPRARSELLGPALVLDDAGGVRWSRRLEDSPLAWSPSGQRVATMYSLEGPSEDPLGVSFDGGGFRASSLQLWVRVESVDAEDEPIELCLSETLRAYLGEDLKGPALWGLAVRRLCFVDETTLAALVSVKEDGRVLLWLADTSRGAREVIWDELGPREAGYALFAGRSCLILQPSVSSRMSSHDAREGTRIFGVHEGRWRLRQAFATKLSPTPKEALPLASLPSGDYVVQLPREPLKRVDPRTGAHVEIGQLEVGEEVAVDGAGAVYGVDLGAGSGPIQVRPLEGRPATVVERSGKWRASPAGPLLAVSEGSQLELLSLEGQPEVRLGLAYPAVEQLHVSPCGEHFVLREDVDMLISLDGKLKAQGVPDAVGMTVGGVMGLLRGRKLDVKQGSKKLFTMQAQAHRSLLRGMRHRAGFLAGNPGGVDRIEVDVAAKSGSTPSRYDLNTHEAPTALDMSLDGRRLVVGLEEAVHLFDGESTRLLAKVELPWRDLRQVHLHADGRRALVICAARALWVDFERETVEALDRPEGRRLRGAALHPRGAGGVVVDDAGYLYALDAGGGTTRLSRHVPGTVALAFTEARLFVGGGTYTPGAPSPARALGIYALGEA